MNDNKAPSNTTHPLVKDAFNLLKQIGHPVEGSPFEQSLAKLQNATYKIAFVGRFQVGKSTLINRAFIKDAALLTSGEGLPTTAVATELKFGETPRLEVFNWNLTGDSIPASDQLEVSAKVVENPSADDMARETANDDPASRTELARKLARVVLEWPSESLKRYTLLDTPGIDDPDEVLLANTTYRLLPECDLAVLVVPAAQLSKIETDFLRQKLFDQGFTRLLVLISYHADTQPRSSAMLARILASIRGQLDSIGRANVPVQMFCYDETAEGDLLKTPAQIESAVLQFANEQAQPARIEKAVHLGLQELHQAGNKLQAEIAANGKTEEERATMLANARKDIAAINRRYDQLMDSLRPRVRAARDLYIDEISNGLRGVSDEFTKGFNTLGMTSGDAYDSAAHHIRGAESYLQPRVQRVFSQAREDFQQKLKKATEELATELSLEQDGDMPSTLNLGERSFLNRTLPQLPGYLVTLGDYLLSIGPIPGGPVISAGLRMLLGKVFEKSQVMPADLLRRWMIGNAKDEIASALTALQNQAANMIMGNAQQIESQIKFGFGEILANELQPLEMALQQPKSDSNTQQLLDWFTQVQRLEQQISTIH
jgi:hypothetical protein